VNIKASINTGLSDTLKKGISNISPIERPIVELTEIPNPNWLVGFANGDGCFRVAIFKFNSCNTGFTIRLIFNISQHSLPQGDIKLLKSFVNYFSGAPSSSEGRQRLHRSLKGRHDGKLELQSKRLACSFVVTKFSDVVGIIIPFFVLQKYPLQGSKRLDFTDFCKVAELRNNKVHLTSEGLKQINVIVSGMNRGRDDSGC